jgi:orotidine-5'-phosphate decarboxylase
LAREVKDDCDGIKLGDVVQEEGMSLVRHCKDQGYFVMVDNKWWDIPKTVANKMRRENDAGADIITVSFNCDLETLLAARKAATREKLVGVTVLTSSGNGSLAEFLRKAYAAVDAGLEGITAPYPLLLEARKDKTAEAALSRLWFVVLGVRMPGDGHRDQKLVATEPPRLASYVVVGAPIQDAEYRLGRTGSGSTATEFPDLAAQVSNVNLPASMALPIEAVVPEGDHFQVMPLLVDRLCKPAQAALGLHEALLPGRLPRSLVLVVELLQCRRHGRDRRLRLDQPGVGGTARVDARRDHRVVAVATELDAVAFEGGQVVVGGAE